MANLETNLTNAYQSSLTAELSSVGTSMTIADVTGLTVPFYLVIEPDNASQREYVYVDDLVGNVATIDSRYLAGSAAGSGLTHPPGSVVRMSVMSQHLVDINDRVDDLQAQINAIGDHGGLTGLTDDDHTNYLNNARHDLDARHTAVNHHALAGLGDDDHPQYLNVARHDADDHSAAVITESQISDLDHTDPDAFHDDVANEIHVLTYKGAPLGSVDEFVIESQADGYAKRRTQVQDLYASVHANTDLGDLDDVALVSPTVGEPLIFGGSGWTNQTLGEAGISAVGHGHDGADITSGTVAIARLPTTTSQTTTSTSLLMPAGSVNAKLQAHTGTGSQVIVSTSGPSGGQNGDIWLQY